MLAREDSRPEFGVLSTVHVHLAGAFLGREFGICDAVTELPDHRIIVGADLRVRLLVTFLAVSSNLVGQAENHLSDPFAEVRLDVAMLDPGILHGIVEDDSAVDVDSVGGVGHGESESGADHGSVHQVGDVRKVSVLLVLVGFDGEQDCPLVQHGAVENLVAHDRILLLWVMTLS